MKESNKIHNKRLNNNLNNLQNIEKQILLYMTEHKTYESSINGWVGAISACKAYAAPKIEAVYWISM